LSAKPERVAMPHVVVLWEVGRITCTCRTLAPDRIEINLVVDGVVVERRTFPDTETASEFALAKMQAYNAN
jgi:hypothetical protein